MIKYSTIRGMVLEQLSLSSSFHFREEPFWWTDEFVGQRAASVAFLADRLFDNPKMTVNSVIKINALNLVGLL